MNYHDDDAWRHPETAADVTTPNARGGLGTSITRRDINAWRATVRCTKETEPSTTVRLHKKEIKHAWRKLEEQIFMYTRTGLKCYWQTYNHCLIIASAAGMHWHQLDATLRIQLHSHSAMHHDNDCKMLMTEFQGHLPYCILRWQILTDVPGSNGVTHTVSGSVG